ncbi:MAG: SAM-dependent methyltransferase [Lachnospiraceae bacterium]|nr:SAM-dependent methyltransferase [Lachnospiraceae bacterium]
MELPVQFRERMLRLLGDEAFCQYEESFKKERMYGLRVNTRKISVEEFIKISPFSIEKIPWIANGFYYDGTKDTPAKHPYYHAGLYYLQEPSAMTPASLLRAEPGDRVLDLCAAPGGKATELGVQLKGRGLLAANDISASRAKGLLKNLELFGIPNVMVTSETPEKLKTVYEGFFDKILIDAPCSGEGMFRKDPAIMKSWVKKGPAQYSVIQREITETALQMLKSGGICLYSTCTFAPEENEGTILYLLKNHPELEVLEAPAYQGFSTGRPEWLEEDCQGYEEQLQRCIRIWPYKMDGEGHFIALLHKKETAGCSKMTRASFIDESGLQKPKSRQAVAAVNKDLEEFLSILKVDWDESCFEFCQGRVYYVAHETQKMRGLHILRNGLLLGECRKNRFEPSQALAMFLTKEQCRQTISLDCGDIRVIKYLKGETIEVEDLVDEQASGWQLVCVSGYPLGWGKLVQGTLKNKYHQGWRWM